MDATASGADLVNGCPGVNASLPLLEDVAGYVDCRAQALGADGFHELTRGSFLPLLLAGTLTIYVALIGYRLMLGGRYSVRDAIIAVTRMALVIVFCSRWDGYQAVFYNAANGGSAQLAAVLTYRAGTPPMSVTDAAARLAQAYDTIQGELRSRPASELIGAYASPTPSASPATPSSGAVQGQIMSDLSGRSKNAVDLGGVIFMASPIGALLAARFAVGFLLSIGPLPILFALFNSTWGVFAGWLRALFGAVISVVTASIINFIEVGFVEHRLDAAMRNGPIFSNLDLWTTAAIFSIMIFTSTYVALRVCGSVRLGTGVVRWLDYDEPPRSTFPKAEIPRIDPQLVGREASISRARTVADAISRLGQRERAQDGPGDLISLRHQSSAPQSSDALSGGSQRLEIDARRSSPGAARTERATLRHGQ